jgi:hypothetical protein
MKIGSEILLPLRYVDYSGFIQLENSESSLNENHGSEILPALI